MDDAAREAAVAAALEHIRRSTAYSAVLRGYGSYEQYEDVAERLSEIRVSASMLPAAGAAAPRRAAPRAPRAGRRPPPALRLPAGGRGAEERGEDKKHLKRVGKRQARPRKNGGRRRHARARRR